MHPLMRDIAVLFVQLVVTIARLFNPGGARAVVAGPDSQSPDPVECAALTIAFDR